MATYRCLKDLLGKTLEREDVVILKDLKYIVQSKYLQEESRSDNSRIFKVLSIPSKENFATNAYGYAHNYGDWPECKKDDYPALTRLVIELYKIIEKISAVYKITTPGKRGISPEQVKELIIKYGGVINNSYNYESEVGTYHWKKGEMVKFATAIFPVYGIEVSPTTEITTTKKEEKHETQFQRKKARIERGTRPEGSTVCGRRGKASVAVGYLGYRKVTGI